MMVVILLFCQIPNLAKIGLRKFCSGVLMVAMKCF